MVDINFKNIYFSEIKTPHPILLKHQETLAPPYIIQRPATLRDESLIITRDAALALAQLHPLIVDHKYRCICGMRLLQLATPYLKPDDQLPVGVLPKKTSGTELKQLIETDLLLQQIIYSTDAPRRSLFIFSQKISNKLLKSLSPALTGNLKNIATFLGYAPKWASVNGWTNNEQ